MEHLSDLVVDEIVAGFPVSDEHRAHLSTCARCAAKLEAFERERSEVIESAAHGRAVARFRSSPPAEPSLEASPSSRPRVRLLPRSIGARRPWLSGSSIPWMLARTPQLSPAGEVHGYLAPPGGDPGSLPEQRWALVAPEGRDGDHLLELVEPLRRKRADDQAGAAVWVYRVAPGMDPDASRRWAQARMGEPEGGDQKLPRYMLILGDLDQVSLGLQRALAEELYVGRLAFPQDDGYAQYVQKVLRWERAPSAARAGRALFFGAHDFDLIERGYLASMLATCRREASLGRFLAREILAIPGDPEQLREHAASAGPDVLFTMADGEELTAEDVTGRPFLPGGLWVSLASFGAATSGESAYSPWIRRLRDQGLAPDEAEAILAGLPSPGRPPSVSALPQAALANPDGPLAFAGHVDLAWSLDCRDVSGFDHSACLASLVNDWVQGQRAGVGHHGLARAAGEVEIQLRVLAQDSAQESTALKRGCLWLAGQDLRALALLGDPAVRLPLASRGSDPVP